MYFSLEEFIVEMEVKLPALLHFGKLRQADRQTERPTDRQTGS